MNTVEQIAGAYGKFSYNPKKQSNEAELNTEFEKLLGSQDNEPKDPIINTGSHVDDDDSTALSAGAGAILYLYNFLGEETVSELHSGANVNKLV